MKAPVRLVCVACLQSLEYSSSDASAATSVCPYCGTPLDLARAESEASTGEDFLSPPLEEPADLKTPKVAAKSLPSGQVGRFIIREPLGEGGYGHVFRAHDPHLDREVALKVLKPHRLNEKALERFFREARAAARLDHPNIVGLHDAGRDDGRCWIAYQLVAGRTLSHIRDHDRPSIDTSVRIVRDLALALDHAHGRGVFHRDLKPANVLIDPQGRARLTDFGLARREDVDSDLTREGTVLGTPSYMSPEAAAGRAHEADARSDVYSLGVILYELICGRKPAEVPSGAPLWKSTRLTTPPTPRSVDRAIPAALDRICMKALAFEPVDRYPTAKLFAEDLTRHLASRPAPRPKAASNGRGGMLIGLVVGASVLCMVLGMSLHVATRRPMPAQMLSVIPVVDVRPAGATPGPVEEASVPPVAKAPVVPGAPEVVVVSPAARFVASRISKPPLFHAQGCSSARQIRDENREEFADAAQAEAQGYRPCGRCQKAGRLDDPKVAPDP